MSKLIVKGRKFNNYTVLESVTIHYTVTKIIKVVCDCGYIQIKSLDRLLQHVKIEGNSCQNCYFITKSVTYKDLPHFENIVAKALQSWNLEYKSHYCIGGDKFVDFYLPQANIVIEVDGEEHYRHDKRISDLRRDALLSELGYVVLRIKNKDLLRDEKYILGSLYKEIMSYVY